MAETKIASKIRKTFAIKKSMKEKRQKENYFKQATEGVKSFDDLYSDIEECWEQSKAIYFNNQSLIFYPELLLLMSTDKIEKIKFVTAQSNPSKAIEKIRILDKWDMEVLTEHEARKIFFEYGKESRSSDCKQILCVSDKGDKVGYIENNGEFIGMTDDIVRYAGELSRTFSGMGYRSAVKKIDTVATLRIPRGYRFDGKTKTKLQILVEIGEIPTTLQSQELLKNLLDLIKKEYVSITKNGIQLTQKGIHAVESGECEKIGTVVISEDYKGEVDQNKIESIDVSKLTPEDKARIFGYYIYCDNIRAKINPYDVAWLEDPNQGHWELWDMNDENDEKEYIHLTPGNKIYGRNPKSDIKSDCIVGIDFGTKSTVVVCQNESGMIRPMPIGNGNIRKELHAKDFENPTVMQFIDFQGFLKNYLEREGRPYTKWQDLIVSHAANESMKDTAVRSAEFYSFLYDLKQWAGEGKKSLNLRDKKGNDLLLTAYTEMDNSEEGQLDPIEIYAYYIGLYINNMNNGIYLDYLLSFPVTYEKDIREAILKSFERGLKKSLPQSIIGDEEVMKHFQVTAGASEPAAYAICALEEYGFEPEDDEKVFYGIFDFGGGTSDFDFGLWTKSEEEDLYDYCIEHFGSQGDRYLGGENLLQLLAFEVFAQNIQLCRKQRIPFAKPLELINIPIELMGYVNDSQEARMNLKLMMEKIRPFWERSDEQGKIVVDLEEFSEFQVGLFNVDGALKSNLAFEVELDRLEEILRTRIEKGVKQFFEALKDRFSAEHVRKIIQTEKIHIFLAGNSSKSPILQEIFQQSIDQWNKNIGNDDEKYFILYPALGTEAAKKIQRERGVPGIDALEAPTGKTGVSWGLIEGREGGRIEVKEEISFESEAKFSYYLGIQKGKKFFAKIHRDEEYSKWLKFLPARRNVNELLYTSLPEAPSGTLLCTENGVLRKRFEIPVIGDDLYIYIRLVSAKSIEYAVGDENGTIDESTIQREDF